MTRYLLALLTLLPFLLSSQLDFKKRTSVLFEEAQDSVKSGNRKAAREICRAIVERRPEHTEALLLIARTYSWDKRFDDGVLYAQKVLDIKPSNKEAYLVWLNCLRWDKNEQGEGENTNEALQVVNQALGVHPMEIPFLLTKAKLLRNQELIDEAVETLMLVMDYDPSNKEAAKMLQELKVIDMVNRIGVIHTYQRFGNSTNHLHSVTLEYRRPTGLGTVLLRNNYSNRFQKDGFQTELDLYPKLYSKAYAYINVGYSATSLFPVWRTGFEVFHKAPYSSEVSLGHRFMQFANSNVNMYTFSVGKYYKNFWFSFRSFLVPKELSFSRSGQFTTRLYTDGQSFYAVRVGFGESPNPNGIAQAVPILEFDKSYTWDVRIQKMIAKRWHFRLSTGMRHVVPATDQVPYVIWQTITGVKLNF